MNHGIHILTLPLFSMNEERYDSKREERRKKFLAQIPEENYKELESEMNSLFIKQDPYCYPYNCIIGFVELTVDGMDILLYYIFNGDRRRKYNENMGRFRSQKNRFYDAIGHHQAYSFRTHSKKAMGKAVLQTLSMIEDECLELSITFDLPYYQNLVSCIDFEKLLTKQHT